MLNVGRFLSLQFFLIIVLCAFKTHAQSCEKNEEHEFDYFEVILPLPDQYGSLFNNFYRVQINFDNNEITLQKEGMKRPDTRFEYKSDSQGNFELDTLGQKILLRSYNPKPYAYTSCSETVQISKHIKKLYEENEDCAFEEALHAYLNNDDLLFHRLNIDSNSANINHYKPKNDQNHKVWCH